MAVSSVATQPNVEAHVWSVLRPIGGIKSWVDASTMDYPPWQSRYEIQVDARGQNRTSAFDRAWQGMYAMLGLPDVPWADGVVTLVQPTVGPSWLPDPDGAPRYVARYEVRVHPAGFVPAGRSVGLSIEDGAP